MRLTLSNFRYSLLIKPELPRRKKIISMESQIRLGRIFGIQVGLHYSWLIIAVLISLSLAGYFSQMHPQWGQSVIWAISIITAVLFFLSILLHELAHAAVARGRGLPVNTITLFALGGVANIEEEPEDPKTEFWMAIVGPGTSALIGAVCLGAARLAGWMANTDPERPLLSMLVWLGYVNLGLAIFNLIPGFPMDGGRVLRAIAWWISGSAAKATRVASISGQLIAIGFIIIGLLQFFNGAGFGGVWLAFIGWFLLSAAKATFFHSELKEKLKGVSVGDLMSPECALVDGNANLERFVDEHLLRSPSRCFIVVQGGAPAGLITLNEVKSVERNLWKFKTTSDVMKPFEDILTVSPNLPALDAFELIGRNGINQLPVLENGALKGIISREQILNYIFMRDELKL
ncbi:MAG: peptidase M50 [Blastocatellia bacterium]